MQAGRPPVIPRYSSYFQRQERFAPNACGRQLYGLPLRQPALKSLSKPGSDLFKPLPEPPPERRVLSRRKQRFEPLGSASKNNHLAEIKKARSALTKGRPKIKGLWAVARNTPPYLRVNCLPPPPRLLPSGHPKRRFRGRMPANDVRPSCLGQSLQFTNINAGFERAQCALRRKRRK
jgi:hypothetical protein